MVTPICRFPIHITVSIIIYAKLNTFVIFLDDLSTGQKTEQSPNYKCIPSSKCAANNAVDKIFSTCMRTDTVGANSQNKAVWWFVDLGNTYSIYSVRILFKDYGHPYGAVIYTILIFLMLRFI